MSIYKFKIKLSNPVAAGGELCVEKKNLHPEAGEYEDGQRRLIILGSPIYRGRIDNVAVARSLLERYPDTSLAREIDGSFLLVLYDKKEHTLMVINDRFASIPFYYHCDNQNLIGSINYSEIFNELWNAGCCSINREVFFEFLHFQRLLGNGTYDTKTKYLDSASILSFRAEKNILEIRRYWRPNFNKRIRAADETSHILAELTAKSIEERTGDGRKYGLLLSGGLDSRLVLSGFKRPVECITVGSYRNNEYFVARELAEAKGFSHRFVKRKDSHYSDILNDAVFIGGAMNVYNHAHFLNLDQELKPKADVFFHGYGFDYMFQGKYLPYTPLKIGGRPTNIKKIKEIKGDIRDKFFSQISYCLKSIDPLSLVVDKEKKKIKESIYSSIEKVLEEGKNCCNNSYDLWEYLIIHNLSRHYTFLNIASIRTFAEERTAAFDNQLFDFYLSLPAEVRANKKIFVDAIRLLDERLYKVRNANTNFNIYDSDFTVTAKSALNKTLRKAGIKALVPPAQNKNDRSWPARSSIVDDNYRINEMAKVLGNSHALEELGFLDMDRVRRCVGTHLEGKEDHADLILTLLTVDTFIKGTTGENRNKDEIAKCLSSQQ